MEAIDTKTVGKYKIEIFPDTDPISPIENDRLGTMVCFHRHYNLGDTHNYNHNDYDGWDEMKKDIIKNQFVGVILPLYLFDHSGLRISTSPFSCPWDSGQIGWIFISKPRIRSEYDRYRISKRLIQTVTEALESEVKEYDQYLSGDVYGFRITDTETEEEVDSCWGYYGEDYCMSEASSIVDYYIKKDKDAIVVV